ncbi:MAG TPA: hypothetical protein VEK07_00200 [Polyangiaceae bacterium]|nr:hypothetical protein [Polyangiaceae bacterium]
MSNEIIFASGLSSLVLATSGLITALPAGESLVQPIQAAIVTLHQFDRTKLAELAQLEDNWDLEGAPCPNKHAIERADAAVTWAETHGLVVEDVEADVLGGVGVRLSVSPKLPRRSAWIALMNNAHDTVVKTEGDNVAGHSSWDAGQGTKNDVVAFLLNVRASAA